MRNEKLKFEMRLMFSFEDDILVICWGEPHHHSKGCISSIAKVYITTPKNKGEVVPAFASLSHF